MTGEDAQWPGFRHVCAHILSCVCMGSVVCAHTGKGCGITDGAGTANRQASQRAMPRRSRAPGCWVPKDPPVVGTDFRLRPSYELNELRDGSRSPRDPHTHHLQTGVQDNCPTSRRAVTGGGEDIHTGHATGPGTGQGPDAPSAGNTPPPLSPARPPHNYVWYLPCVGRRGVRAMQAGAALKEGAGK